MTDHERAWNQRYDREEYIFGKLPNAYLASQAALLKSGQRALLVAEGEGRNAVWCAQLGLQVDAFDLSPVGLEKARRLAQEQGVRANFFVSGWQEWSWTPEAYDVVILVFAHFVADEERARLFANCVTTLRSGGLLIVQGYTPGQLAFKTGGPPDPALLYTENTLRQAFAALDILECREYEAELNEGTRHVGHSALCGLVARKP